MRSHKATKSQIREHNRQLVLRAVYAGLADNRAALAQETALTKPAISDLVAELMEEGLLVEEGLGESGNAGGKRPILLRFVPDARQVIGISMNGSSISGMLTNLDGRIIAEHYTPIAENEPHEQVLLETINGLVAQLNAPLLCLGVGISPVQEEEDTHHTSARLVQLLETYYDVPAYVFNNSELAVMAQAAFGNLENVERLATILIGYHIGVGLMLENMTHQVGNELDHMRIIPPHQDEPQPICRFLAWQYVRQRAWELGDIHQSPYLQDKKLSYLHIRQGVANGDQAALILQDELAFYLAQIYGWVIALIRPNHISLVGLIADLGEPFLEVLRQQIEKRLPLEVVQQITFSVDNTPNLVVMGAAAKAVRSELGLV